MSQTMKAPKLMIEIVDGPAAGRHVEVQSYLSAPRQMPFYNETEAQTISEYDAIPVYSKLPVEVVTYHLRERIGLNHPREWVYSIHAASY